MRMVLWIVVAGSLANHSPDNPVLKQLVERGIPAENGQVVRLPRPTMPDGLDHAGQQEVLARVAAPNRRVADLARGRTVALDQVAVEHEAGTVALDGERELGFEPGERVTATLRENAFLTVDVARCMHLAASAGLLRSHLP